MAAVKMHADEADIDEELVLRLVGAQFPQYAGLPVKEIPYRTTNPGIVANAQYVIDQVIEDFTA